MKYAGYPWQNTAMVGVLDAFWDSKGLITPEAWREFCGPVVPLARMRSRTWTTAERFEAAVDVAHYGPVDLAEAPAAWKLTLLDGRSVASGELPGKSIPRGGLRPLGRIEAPLSNVSAPSKLLLTVAVGRPAFTNSWELWVYPDRPASADPADVKIFREWGEEVRVALAAGGKVLVLPGEKQLPHSLPGIFTPVYWSWLYFQPRQVGTMGLLCDPRHPAFAEFPTEYHSNWQWWEPITHSRTLVLDGLPGSLRPLIQVIDKFDTCRRLGAVFEARVGPGRLMVCTIDLQSDLDRRPVTRQLRHSLLAYMAGDRFEPGCRLDPGVLDTLFVNPEAPATRP